MILYKHVMYIIICISKHKINEIIGKIQATMSKTIETANTEPDYQNILEKYQDKFIRFISSKSNSKLTTWFKGDSQPYTENSNLKVSDIERSRFLPEIIRFNHQVDDDLMDWILGTTDVKINGEIEKVPNFYFKFEFINELGYRERGYLMELNPADKGEFTFQKANENIL